MGLLNLRFLPARRRKWSRLVVIVIGFVVTPVCFLFISVVYTPHMVNSVAYVTGVGGTDTFIAQAHGQDCSRKGDCHPFTTGVLERSGIAVTWPGEVALGSRFPVRAPLWPVGMGRTIISGIVDAVWAILGTLFLYGMVLLFWGIPLFVWSRALAERRRAREYAGRRGKG